MNTDKEGRVIAPTDYCKVGVADFAKVCEVDAIEAIVTERRTDYL